MRYMLKTMGRHDEHELVLSAHGRLQEISRLRTRLAASTDPAVDAALAVARDDVWTTYSCLVKPRVRPSTLGPILAQLRAIGETQPATTPLLVSDHITRSVADRLVGERVQFIDASGNAFLEAPDYLVMISGRERQAAASPKHALTPAKLQVLYVLLKRKELRNANYEEIARAARVSLGTVSHTIATLQQDGHLTGPKGRRRFLRFRQTLDSWTLHYADQLRPRLVKERFALGRGRTLESFAKEVADVAAGPGAKRLAVGGELGADRLTGHLRPATVTLHTSLTPRELLLTFKLRPLHDGEVILLDELTACDGADAADAALLADPILIYAELLASGGERQRATADLVLHRHVLPRESSP